MRLYFCFALLAVLATAALAWEKEDHEIFDLVREIELSEGKGTTFYSWLDVPSTATTPEIAKAYRKLSMQLHPDKNPNGKNVHERFARLGLVGAILRNTESRKRYDFFYKNGVPKWRGTGYYYSRFRPGLGSVFTFLITVTSIVHYIILGINYKKDLERLETIISRARMAAWGTKQVAGIGQKKVKVNLGARADEGCCNDNKCVEMVVQGMDVYVLDLNGDMHILDATTAIKPSIINTWFLASIQALYRRLRGSEKLGSEGYAVQHDDSDSLTSATDTPESEAGSPIEDGRLSRRTSKGRRRGFRKR